MSYFLSKEESNFYEDEGYLVRENQFSINEVNVLRNAFERAVNKAQEKASSGKVYYLDKKKFVDVDRKKSDSVEDKAGKMMDDAAKKPFYGY